MTITDQPHTDRLTRSREQAVAEIRQATTPAEAHEVAAYALRNAARWIEYGWPEQAHLLIAEAAVVHRETCDRLVQSAVARHTASA